jgi:Mlc titration factor MtfA (ptsG expression regulator)
MTLPLDPYAATDPAEFFAVSGEVFFVAPDLLADAFPDWFDELRAFFRQDPRTSDDAAPTPSGD